MKFSYAIVRDMQNYILIRDLCEQMQCMSITNAAEAVVKDVFERHNLAHRRLFYIDTEGDTDELVHENGVFKDFAFGGPPDEL